MRIEERHGQAVARTSDQILGEIRDFCRATQTAESTFGRLVVNDGKLVSRLRDGARITTATLDKVRAYLAEHRTASAAAQHQPAAAARPLNGATVAAEIVPPGFRFFDNRQ
jgi:topoisomerase IA-like protein